MESGPGFAQLLWGHLDGKPKQNKFRSTKQVPAETELSRKMSKELVARGFKFVGPTIVYAFMQAVGMVNDHLVACHRHATAHAAPVRLRAKLGRKAVHIDADPRTPASPTLAQGGGEKQRAPGSACCRDGGSICSTPPRSTSRSRTSRTAWRASRAGTGRPRAPTSSRSPSTRCWSRRWRAREAPRLDAAARLAVLLHDAPEYVVGDMISPFKAVIGDSYKAVEKRLLAAIHLRFGLPVKLPESLQALIKTADRGAAYLEATRLAGFDRPRRASSSAWSRSSRTRSSTTISAPGRRKRPSSASATASSG